MKLTISTFDDIARDSCAIYHPSSPREPSDPIRFGLVTLADAADDMVELRNATILHRGGIVWNGHWIDGNSIHYYATNWAQEHWRPGEPDASGRTIDIAEEHTRPLTHVRGPAVFCDSGWGSRNFGHFVHDFLPYGRIFRALRGAVPRLVPLANQMRWDSQRRIMEAVFDVRAADCARIDHTTLVDHLYLPRRQSVLDGPVWTTSFAGLRGARRWTMERLELDAVGHASELVRPLKILLHRTLDLSDPSAQRLLNGRNFANPGALAAALLDAGFVALEPGKVPIELVVAVMARADTVVGIHGENLGNILFCPPGARIFELRPAAGVWADYEAVANVLGQHFTGVVQPRPAAGEDPVIDVAGVMRLLEAAKG